MKFSQLVGQEKAKTAFFNAANDSRLAHAIILKGPEGVGKLAFATAMAQYINCEEPEGQEACGRCPNCIKISKGIHPDIQYILPIFNKKLEGKQLLSEDFMGQFRQHFFKNPYFSLEEWNHLIEGENKQLGIHIHEIRSLKRKLSLKAFEADYKVVIFWNAEKINTEGANALLKILEEPPEKTILILTVSDPTKLLTTINSRCQRIQLHSIPVQALQEYLQNKYQLGPEQAFQIAQISEGSIAKAHELIQETSQSLSELYQNWLRICFEGNHAKILSWVEALSKENKEFQKLFISYALQKLRDSLLYSFNLQNLALVTDSEKAFHEKFSKFIQWGGINEASKLLEDSLYYISRNANSQMTFIVLSHRLHSLLNGKVLI